MPATITKTRTAVIPANSATSGGIDLGQTDGVSEIVALVIPPVFTGTTVSFNVAPDDPAVTGLDFQPLFDDAGAQVTITVAAGRTYGLRQDRRSTLSRFRFIQIVSSSSEAAARSILVIIK